MSFKKGYKKWTVQEKENLSNVCKNRVRHKCWVCGRELSIGNLTYHLKAHEKRGIKIDWSLLPLKPIIPLEERKRLGSERSRKAAMGNKRARANKGKKHSEEQNRRHSEIMTGRKMSVEQKQKIANSHKNKWNSLTDKQKQERIENTLPQSYNPSKLEIKVHNNLEKQGLYFIKHPWFHFNADGERKVFQPDIYLPEKDLIIEVQGCYWHGCPQCFGEKALQKHIQNDVIRKEIFEMEGYTMIHIWEHEIKDPSFSFELLEQNYF